jgi:hypothetical protein
MKEDFPSVTGPVSHLEEIEGDILVAVNAERAKENLPATHFDENLRISARKHSDDMLVRGFFDHVNPSGESPADRIERAHRRLIGITGENIWASSGGEPAKGPALARQIVSDWMNSPGHRENILRRELTQLGVGVSLSGFEVRATQDFASRQSLLAEPLPPSVQQGEKIDLSVLPGDSSPERFDVWSRETGLKVSGPAPVGVVKLAAAPGRYVLRFYYARDSRSFTVYKGPSLDIVE